MQNSCVQLCLILLILVSCSTSRVNIETTNFKKAFNNLGRINWDFTPERIKNTLGEPSNQIFDEKTKTRVFLYHDSNEKNARSRLYFIFENRPEVLTKKYINLFENDPESSLDFWNNKSLSNSTSSDFEIQTRTVCLGHSIEIFQYAEITKSQRIEIEKGKVVRVFWQKTPFVEEKAVDCK